MLNHGNSGRKPAKRMSHKLRILWLLFLTVGILSATGWMFQQPETAASATSVAADGVKAVEGAKSCEALPFGRRYDQRKYTTY